MLPEVWGPVLTVSTRTVCTTLRDSLKPFSLHKCSCLSKSPQPFNECTKWHLTAPPCEPVLRLEWHQGVLQQVVLQLITGCLVTVQDFPDDGEEVLLLAGFRELLSSLFWLLRDQRLCV